MQALDASLCELRSHLNIQMKFRSNEQMWHIRSTLTVRETPSCPTSIHPSIHLVSCGPDVDAQVLPGASSPCPHDDDSNPTSNTGRGSSSPQRTLGSWVSWNSTVSYSTSNSQKVHKIHVRATYPLHHAN